MLKRLFGRPTPPTPPPIDAESPAHPGDLTDATFDAGVGSTTLTVVDFWAEWCQPCTIMSAYVEMLAREYGDRLRVLALDVEENPHSAERYDVRGLPTLIFFRSGQEIARTVGVSGYEDLRRMTERLLPPG